MINSELDGPNRSLIGELMTAMQAEAANHNGRNHLRRNSWLVRDTDEGP